MTDAPWKEQRGEKPHRVTVYEWAAKGGTVWLKWYERVDGRSVPRTELTQVKRVRDSKGRTLARAIHAAQREADVKSEELAGLRPRKASGGPMTLRDGLRVAFSERGCYPHDPKRDNWTKDARRYAENAVRLLGGDDVLWEEVTPGMLRAVWRKMEKEGAGHDKATKTLVVLFHIAGWLEGEIPTGRFPRPMKGWRAELLEHWTKRGRDTARHRPRHAPEEVERLFRNLHKADPRLRIMLVIGAELRGGQVVRTKRSDCDFSGDVWTVTIPSVSRRKRAPKLALNARERGEVEAALTTGYLSDVEAAYREGSVSDYYLFPTGKLKGGKAVLERAERAHLSKDRIAGIFHRFERAAGVTPVEGRAWYGLRRAFSDLYEATAGDERVKDQLGGWKPGSDMRRSIYQEQESESVLKQASEQRLRRPGFQGRE